MRESQSGKKVAWIMTTAELNYPLVWGNLSDKPLLSKIRRHIHAHQQHCRIIKVGMEAVMNTATPPAVA